MIKLWILVGQVINLSQAISKLQTEKLMDIEVLSWILYSITDAHSLNDQILDFDWPSSEFVTSNRQVANRESYGYRGPFMNLIQYNRCPFFN